MVWHMTRPQYNLVRGIGSRIRDSQTARVTGARVGAEFVSFAAAMGSIWVVSELFHDQLKGVKHYFAKHVILPHIGFYDRQINDFKGFDDKDFRQWRAHASAEQRAEKYADGIINFSLMTAGSVVGQFYGQKFFDPALGVKEISDMRQWAVVATDRSTQIGSMIALNKLTPDMTQRWRRGLTSVLEKTTGMDHDKAEDRANYIINMQ
jgi:hypothetical protein